MTVDKVHSLLETLTDFEPVDVPVLSIYLNAQPNQQGRDDYRVFLRKELNERSKTFAEGSKAQASFDRDVERIMDYLVGVDPSSNGIVIIACAGYNDYWEAIQLTMPIEENELYVYNQPHLYPLARLTDQYPRYAALMIDTNSAKIFVFGSNKLQETENIDNIKTSRTDVGGWSQARYQRHNENFHLHHAKEVVERLDDIVRAENIEQIVISGSDAIMPLFKDYMTPYLKDRVIDEVALDMKSTLHHIMQTTLDAVRGHDSETDAEHVNNLFEQYRAGGGGLAVVGVADTLAALNNGQVDRLLISASALEIHPDEQELAKTVAAYEPAATTKISDSELDIHDELVTKARQTHANITFVEDTELLQDVQGVGALLRWQTRS